MKTVSMEMARFNESGVCLGCMNNNRKLYYSHKIKECFKLIADIHVPDGLIIQVCWECIAYINNIFKFKDTIEQSYNVLLEYSTKFKLMDAPADISNNAPQRLQVVGIEIMSYPADFDIPIDFLESEYLELDNDNINLASGTNIGKNYLVGQDERTESEAVYNWKRDETFLLIQCYEKEGVHLLTEKRDVSRAFQRCVNNFNNILMERSGKTVPVSKCVSKIDCLKRVYRQKLKMKKKSGRIRVAWPYFEVLHELFHNKYGVKPTSEEAEEFSINSADDPKLAIKKEEPELDSSDDLETTELADDKFVELAPLQDLQNLLPKSPEPAASPISVRKSKRKTQSQTHKCNFCSIKFDNAEDLTAHLTSHADEKSYRCKFCSYKCDRSSVLKRHVLIHTGEKPFSCKFCTYKCNRSSQLKSHTATHTGEKPYKCQLCPLKFTGSFHLKRHVYTHTGEKPFSCDLCSYRCRIHSNLKKHKINKHSGQKPFKCDNCSYTCSAKFELAYHMRRHTGEKPYVCEFCSYRSSSSAGLRAHKVIHSDEKPFSCEICSYTCKSKARLKLHMCRHTGEKRFDCKHCPFKCANRGNLKMHVSRVHSKDKPFVCEVCSYRCAGKFELIVHTRRHTGEKPFACEYCPYKCTTSGALRRHIRTHTGETPYSCDVCSFKCSSRMKLKVHMCKHTGVKLFSCEFCPHQCNDRTKLKIHIKRLHTIKKSSSPTSLTTY